MIRRPEGQRGNDQAHTRPRPLRTLCSAVLNNLLYSYYTAKHTVPGNEHGFSHQYTYINVKWDRELKNKYLEYGI